MSPFHQVPNRYLKPPREKDYYNFFYNLLLENGVSRLLDVGTASGDFLYFLPDKISAVGIDSSAELIQEANRTRKKTNLSFLVSDIEDYSPVGQFDAITILGTLVTIEDWERILQKCIEIRPKLLLIHDVFNPVPVDIKLGFRDSGSAGREYNYGYNVISLKSITNFFSKNFIPCHISEFHLTTLLPRDLENPMYNYHVNLDGDNVLTNGTNLVLRMYNVVAEIV